MINMTQIRNFSFFTGFLLTLFCWSQSNAMIVNYKGLPIRDLKFSKECPEEGHRFDPETGSFMCVIPTAKECFEVCQWVGCNEWFFANMISSRNETRNPYHRCRCVPQLKMCLYNPIPPEYRDFTV